MSPSTLACDDTGGAGREVVVLLHGIGGGRQIWDAAHSGTALALAAAGYRVLAVDLPGYGGSPLPRTPLTVSSMAEAVVQFLQHKDIARAHVLGHSMGGMVAQEIAALHPQFLQTVVLACTSSALGKPGGDWQQAFVQARLKPLDDGLGMLELARQLVAGMVAPGCPAGLQALGSQVMAQVPEATYRAALQAIVAFDRRAALATLGVPTLCLAAEHDRTAPPDVMQRMSQRLPLGDYACIPGAGHLANVENSAAFSQAVIEFLNRHSGHRTMAGH